MTSTSSRKQPLNNIKKVNLDYWEEVIGTFNGLQLNEDKIQIELLLNSHVLLEYPKNSKEAEILREKLQHLQPGATVSIIKTDLENRPIIVIP